MPEPTVFGRRLKKLRTDRGWTQEDLAGKSGVPAAMISHFETGRRGQASADNLVKLANALEATIDYLLGRSEEPQLSSERVSAVLRSLATASEETIDSAADVVRALVERDQQRKKSDEAEGEGDSQDGE